MSRTRSAAPTVSPTPTASPAPLVDRRAFLAAAGAVGASTALALAYGAGAAPTAAPGGTAPPLVAPEPVVAPPVPRVPYAEGTTLASVATPRGAPAGYRRLAEGPGWDRVVRRDLAAAHPGRDDRRTVLAAFAQLTDLHLVDVQNPLRHEYLRVRAAGAWRPQEALSVAGAVSLVARVNSLPGGPATGAPLSFAMTTGDNTDNNSSIELDWFLTALSGGRITPNSGDPRHYEGVQNSGHPLYWQPDSALRDADKLRGFPGVPGFLEAATRTVTSPGLHLPWYSTVGNHDSLPGGCCTPDDPFLAEIATGGRKLELLPADEAIRAYLAVLGGPGPGRREFADLLKAHGRRARSVTPDERRVPFTRAGYLRAHLDPRHTGPGPHGHGYTAADLDADRLYYTFRIAEDVVGVSLDTTDPGGHHTGSVGSGQLRWLDRTLRAHRYEHVLVFSHHTSTSMDNTLPDPARPAERRHGGAELAALLARHRNVRAWINGHSHRNRITPHGTFWEVTTASHVDFPQLARVVEVTDNRDGTLSLFTTLVESDAPYRTDFGDLSQRGLAALYRELACNAPGARSDLAGGPGDRNTELLLKRC